MPCSASTLFRHRGKKYEAFWLTYTEGERRKSKNNQQLYRSILILKESMNVCNFDSLFWITHMTYL